MQAKLDEYIEATDSKNAKILKDYACSAFYGYKEGTNTGAVCLEFITKRDRKT